jgi:DNA modification methylase
MLLYQPALPFKQDNPPSNDANKKKPIRERLALSLEEDLDFHGQNSDYASHNFHSFPAKFPPQLPQKFIQLLTEPGDVVLDSMMGSGTTVVEAFLSGRQAVGFDIDPLALKLAQVKVSPLDRNEIVHTANEIVGKASHSLRGDKEVLDCELTQIWDANTRKFIDYWFVSETQRELWALLREIRQIGNIEVRAFFELALSSIIITKSGGVSLAFDLAHTRPHRAKKVLAPDGRIIVQVEDEAISEARLKVLTKRLRPAVSEFAKRVQKNLDGIPDKQENACPVRIAAGNAQNLPLPNDCVNLIVTSPPYASNAIDYMRAHKFSLAWLGYAINDLGQLRGDYIGGEATNDFVFETLPAHTQKIVDTIACQEEKRGLVLHRYYSEMTRALREMYRVLKPDSAAIVVVGSSIMRGIDTETQNCLAEIGQNIGFEVPYIGIRQLDRDRRMLPSGTQVNRHSQIQQRMHEEYVVGFHKPTL